MTKLMKIILAICLGSGIVGCQSNEDNGKEAVEAFKGIVSEYRKYANKDYDKFAKLYTSNTDKIEIKEDFKRNVSKYKNEWYYLIANYNNYYYVGYKCHKVNKDGSVDYDWMNRILCKEDGEWKIEDSGKAWAQINKPLDTDPKYSSDGFVEAYNFLNNNYVFDYDYSYLNGSYYYKGVSSARVKYIYQQDDGNLVVGIVFNNGTDKPLNLDYAVVEIADKNHTIVSDEVYFAESVVPKSISLVEGVISYKNKKKWNYEDGLEVKEFDWYTTE